MGVDDAARCDTPMQSPPMHPYSDPTSRSSTSALRTSYYYAQVSTFNQATHSDDNTLATRDMAEIDWRSFHTPFSNPSHHGPMKPSHLDHCSSNTQDTTSLRTKAKDPHFCNMMQKTTGAQRSQQASKKTAPLKRDSRDLNSKRRISSLCATHPANYAQHVSKQMPPPLPPKLFPELMTYQPTPSPSASAPSSRRSSSALPQEVPWRQYTDPMHQTSTDANYWQKNHTFLKRDTDVSQGNVISPTCMIGLPFGSMTELGHHYMTEEGRERANSSATPE